MSPTDTEGRGWGPGACSALQLLAGVATHSWSTHSLHLPGYLLIQAACSDLRLWAGVDARGRPSLGLPLLDLCSMCGFSLLQSTRFDILQLQAHVALVGFIITYVTTLRSWGKLAVACFSASLISASWL